VDAHWLGFVDLVECTSEHAVSSLKNFANLVTLPNAFRRCGSATGCP
jgi:hypothetical protein